MLIQSSMALAATVLLAAPAHAGPIYDYRISLLVDSVTKIGCEQRVAMNLQHKPDAQHFGCNWKSGDIIRGDFRLRDDESGLQNGLYRLGVESFNITIGTAVFDIVELGGAIPVYASACPIAPDRLTDTAVVSMPSMRMIVGGGVVTGFCDSLRGPGGFPALQLLYREPYGYGFAAYDYFSDVSLSGWIDVRQIPEPASLALAGTALLGAAIVRRRRPSGCKTRSTATPVSWADTN